MEISGWVEQIKARCNAVHDKYLFFAQWTLTRVKPFGSSLVLYFQSAYFGNIIKKGRSNERLLILTI